MSLKSLFHGFIAGIGVAKREEDGSKEHNSGVFTSDELDTRIAVIAFTQTKELGLTLERIAAMHDWRLLWSKSWADALLGVERRITGVVLLDENQLGTDWRDALQMLLAPAHRCCVVLIMSGAHPTFCEDFIQEGGFNTLTMPIREPEVIEIVQSAWDCWNCIRQAYDYS